MQSRFIEINEQQATFLLQCIDTHQKAHGIKVSGNCYAMANLIDSEFKKIPDENVAELTKKEAI